MLSDDPIDLTVDPRDLLLWVIIDESILFLFQQFDCYPPCPSHYILPPNLQSTLHYDPVQEFNYRSLLKASPPALQFFSKTYQDTLKKSKHPILSVTLQSYHGDPIRLPAWIFEYWVEIEHAVDTQKQ